MAKHMDISGNSAKGLTIGSSRTKSGRMGGSGIPKYVGAEAEVTRVESGVKIRLKDYRGTTEEIVAEAISDIITNEDGSITFVLPNGREITTDSLKGDPGTLPMYYGTTDEWNAQTGLQSEAGAIYVYTDHAIVDGEEVPGLKLGDGTSYLIDLPFIDAVLWKHINDTNVHITSEEREFWNNKESSRIEGETLILTKL